MENHVIWKQVQFSFFVICVPCISLPCPMAPLRTRGRPRLIPDPTRKGSSFSPFSTMAAVGPVWIDAHYQVDEYSS